MRTILALAFLAAFLLSVVLVVVVRWQAGGLGLLDRPGGRKQHGRAVPLGGGLAIWAATCLPLLVTALGSWLWTREAALVPVPAALEADVALAAERLPTLLTVLAGGLAVMLLGLVDDLRDLPAAPKLAVQIVVALAVASVPEVRLTLFIPLPAVQTVVTAAWFVLLMNAFNLLDNMDGQTGLIAFLTGGALLVLALQTGQHFIAGMLVCLLGAVLGFLLFNLPPASVFMGDAGALFVGYMLAVSTTLCTFITDRHVNPLFPMLVPVVIFAVPLYDVVSVLFIRLRRGSPLMQGDRNHFSHRMIRLGMSDRMVLLTAALTVVATSPGATMPYGSPTWQVVIPAVQAGAVVLVIIMLEATAARRRNGRG